MFEIIPGILEKEWSEIEKKLAIATQFAKSIHIDIIDGKLFETTTFLDPEPFRKYTKETFFELHMMVDEPMMYLDAWAGVGFKRFIGHVEKMTDQVAFVAKAQQFGEVGLAFDAKTPLDTMHIPQLDLDTVLIMTIDAGASGRPFQENQLEKVKKLAEHDALFPIAVDGGIQAESLQKAKQAGARRFVATSAIFGTDDPHAAYTNLTNALVG